jgi:hypothetical protein
VLQPGGQVVAWNEVALVQDLGANVMILKKLHVHYGEKMAADRNPVFNYPFER